MINWKLSKEYFSFFSKRNNSLIPLVNWKNFTEGEFIAQYIILKELLENGKADNDEFYIYVPYEEICLINETDRQILNLPPTYPFDIYIYSIGTLNQSTCKLIYGFYEFAPHGKQLFGKRIGCCLKLDDNSEYLLNLEQYLLCNAIDEFNDLTEEERTFNNNLIRFADIKSLSEKSSSILDSYLNNENVVVPKQIKININLDKDRNLEILPEIEAIDNSKFQESFDKYPDIQNIYNIQDDKGKRQRIIINDKQKEALKDIKKKYRKISNDNLKAEIVEKPELYFNSEIVDFSILYSNRVVEIGIYKPKFYPFVCPYKSEWIPGFSIKDKINGEQRVYFKKEEEFEKFKEEYEKILKTQNPYVIYKNKQIPIEDARQIIDICKKQFKDVSCPVKDRNVLIIKENAEVLEYSIEEFIKDAKYKFSEVPNIKPETKFKAHQKEGIAWLQYLFDSNASGALLADDMGLGKTLQILSLIEWHNKYKNNLNKPYLIVAPLSLLESWQNEYKKFFSNPSLEIINLYDNNISLYLRGNQKDKIKKLQKRHIILTNYETLRNHQLVLCAVDFAIAIIDEAQRIKTPGTLITNAVKAIKSDFKIAMTGTPVENTLIDIWCIIDYAVPGLLGSAKEFAKYYQNPLKNSDTDIKNIGENLRKDIGIYLKRRMKSDVLKELPPKHERKIKEYMPPIQLERYELEIVQYHNTSNTAIDKRGNILRTLFMIRDISDHPYIVDKQISMFDAKELIQTSAKLKITYNLLNEIKSKNEKVILFTDRRETQKLLAKILIECFDISPSIINGDTPANIKRENSSRLNRQQHIDEFQKEEGFNVIIMSPLAVGLGLNITAANHVIHYSRQWNPAKENQATDRVHRIGQTKDVYVYYPIAESPNFKSFDLILDELIKRKEALANATLFPTERIEVTPYELIDEAINFTPGEKRYHILKLEDLDKLNPIYFESSIAALFRNQGFDVLLTPIKNDKGADLIGFSEKGNILIQVKQSKYEVGDSAIGEILKSGGFYEKKYQNKFQLYVLTNNYFTNSARIIANSNNVKTIDRSGLRKLIENNRITFLEVEKEELKRLQSV